MPHLSLPGAELYWESDGHASAPALLAIPGGMGALHTWDGLVDACTPTHRVVRFDPRGYGATIARPAPFANHLDALGLLDHLGIPSATIVGAGRGATAALDLALAAPDRVDGVVMVCGGPSGHPAVELTAREERMLAAYDALHEPRRGPADGAAPADAPDTPASPGSPTPPADGVPPAVLDVDALVEQELAIWAAGPRRALRDLDPAFVAAARRHDRHGRHRDRRLPRSTPLVPSAYERLESIEAPVLVMSGAYDLSPAIAHYRTLVERLPNADGFVFDDTAHLPVLERPDEFAHVLAAWLRDR